MSLADQTLPLAETVAPAEPAEVGDVVRVAWESGTPVYPIGGGTALDYGLRPTLPGLGLSLARLGRVVDYPARDLTITVEAGVTIAELAGRLAEERQRLPVDVPQADRATIGGVVATNPSGPRRYHAGTIRDYVIGIHAVDGRGVAFAAGGRVVKNAAGYDLGRLLVGSLGTLAVMTQVSLMVKPMPETSAFLAASVPDFDAAGRLLADLVQTETLPAAIELWMGPAWQDLPPFGEQPASGGLALAVGFEGTRAEVDWMTDQLAVEWRRTAGSQPTPVRGDPCARLWSRLTEFPAPAAPSGGDGPLVVQAAVLPSAVVGFFRRLVEADPGCSIRAHAGDGIIQAQLSREPGEAVALLREELRPLARAAGGSIVVLASGKSRELSRDDVWGPPSPHAALNQAIKDRFDPKGILNPGRFIYGNP